MHSAYLRQIAPSHCITWPGPAYNMQNVKKHSAYQRLIVWSLDHMLVMWTSHDPEHPVQWKQIYLSHQILQKEWRSWSLEYPSIVVLPRVRALLKKGWRSMVNGWRRWGWDSSSPMYHLKLLLAPAQFLLQTHTLLVMLHHLYRTKKWPLTDKMSQQTKTFSCRKFSHQTNENFHVEQNFVQKWKIYKSFHVKQSFVQLHNTRKLPTRHNSAENISSAYFLYIAKRMK